MMTSAQVVETLVNVITNSPSQDYTHPDDHNLPNYDDYYYYYYYYYFYYNYYNCYCYYYYYYCYYYCWTLIWTFDWGLEGLREECLLSMSYC